jgi:hypothetical protein
MRRFFSFRFRVLGLEKVSIPLASSPISCTMDRRVIPDISGRLLTAFRASQLLFRHLLKAFVMPALNYARRLRP